MKKLMLLTTMVVMSLSISNLSAQPRKGGEERRESPEQCVEQSAEKIATRRSEQLKREYELTDAQYEKVYAIEMESAKEMITQREEQRKEAEAKREAAKAKEAEKREANNAEMKAILTPEQYEKFTANEKRQAQRGERRDERGERGDRGRMRQGAPRGKGGECKEGEPRPKGIKRGEERPRKRAQLPEESEAEQLAE